MRQDGTIHMQDPAASPTFALSRPANNPDVPSSLRRNLFAPHLSRRPTATVPNVSTERMPDPFQVMAPTNHYPQPEIYQPVVQHSQQATSTNLHSFHGSHFSPARSLSPVKSQIYTTSVHSIIDLDPITGKPQLPFIPTLPPVMPDGSEEEEGEDDEEHEEEDAVDEHATAAWRQARVLERANVTQHDLELHSSSLGGMPSQNTYLHDLIDPSMSMADYTDFEKIESILSEMQSLQKARARTAVLPESSSSLSLDTPMDGGVSARTRGKSRANPRSPVEQKIHSPSTDRARVGGVGAMLKPSDKNELLSLIMTSLSKRVHEADDDAWMFGDGRTTNNGTFVSGSFDYAARD